MRDFWRYLLRYFTHYAPVTFAKKNGMLKKDAWYKVTMHIKYGSNDMYIDNLKIFTEEK